MKRLVTAMLMVAALALVTNTATASTTLDNVAGTWTGTNGGTNVQYQTVAVGYGNGSQEEVRWGVPYPSSVPDTIDNQSGLGFTGIAPDPIPVDLGVPFEIGQLMHFNHEIGNDGSPTEAYLQLVLDFGTEEGPVSATLDLTFGVNETRGLGTDDIISLPETLPSQIVLVGEDEYLVRLLGFGDSPEPPFVTQLVSVENGEPSSTRLWGMVTPVVPAPGAVLLGGIGLSLVGYLRRRRAL